MTVVTLPNVEVEDDGWTELSNSSSQKLQVIKGTAGIIYADTQPSATVQVGDMGYVLNTGNFLNNEYGGTSWARAEYGSRSAHIGITESFVAFTARGSVNSSSPYVLRVTMNAPINGTPPYSTYKATIDFLHANQNGRRIVVSGNSLNIAPVAITDTESKVTLGGTGAIVCDKETTINSLLVANGSTQKVFNGTLGYFEIVSNLANLYGDITIKVSVVDSLNDYAEVIL